MRKISEIFSTPVLLVLQLVAQGQTTQPIQYPPAVWCQPAIPAA